MIFLISNWSGVGSPFLIQMVWVTFSDRHSIHFHTLIISRGASQLLITFGDLLEVVVYMPEFQIRSIALETK